MVEIVNHKYLSSVVSVNHGQSLNGCSIGSQFPCSIFRHMVFMELLLDYCYFLHTRSTWIATKFLSCFFSLTVLIFFLYLSCFRFQREVKSLELIILWDLHLHTHLTKSREIYILHLQLIFWKIWLDFQVCRPSIVPCICPSVNSSAAEVSSLLRILL